MSSAFTKKSMKARHEGATRQDRDNLRLGTELSLDKVLVDSCRLAGFSVSGVTDQTLIWSDDLVAIVGLVERSRAEQGREPRILFKHNLRDLVEYWERK